MERETFCWWSFVVVVANVLGWARPGPAVRISWDRSGSPAFLPPHCTAALLYIEKREETRRVIPTGCGRSRSHRVILNLSES
eukprot:scaffold289_cov39-Tisochrysis_lutea.AAC.3